MNFSKIAAVAFLVSASLVSAAHAQYNGDKATVGNCWIAIHKAQENGNEWSAPFAIDDCRAVFGKMMDDGEKMIERSERDD